MAVQHFQIFQDWRISSIISDCIAFISIFVSWEAKKINKNINFCIYFAAH
jgi:hypothetical protein